MKKIFTLSLAISMSLSLSAEGFRILSCGLGFPGVEEPQLYGLSLSPDGKYACGSVEFGDGIFIADLETNEVKWVMATTDKGGELRHIDNNGVAVGVTDTGITYSFSTGEISVINPPAGYKYVLVEDITNDGALMVGSPVASNETDAAFCAGGNEWTLLPVPSKEELGALYPRSDSSAAKLVSGDGNVIFGYLGSFGIPVLWTSNGAGGYDYDFFPARYIKTTEADLDNPDLPLQGLSAMYLSMSNNGRYLSMVGLIVDDEGRSVNVPVIYDTVEKTLTIHSAKQEIDETGLGLYPTAICDDGTFIGTVGKPYYQSIGSFIMKAGQTQAEFFSDVFPKYAAELGEGDTLGFHIPTSMSADGRYILGYAFCCDDYHDPNQYAYYVTYLIDTQDGGAAINTVASDTMQPAPEAIYDLNGRRLGKMSPGINIVRMTDGTVRKIISK